MRRNGIRLRPLLSLAAAFALALGSTSAALAAKASWDGSFDVYRAGTFTTQRSWLWCTAAGVQIARNIVDRQADHSTGGQRRYFEWMRRHNRYDLPLSAGVDPAGWTAGMRRFVDDRYRLVASTSFDSALRSAVQRMRATSLPVALAVQHGNHGWVLTGFSATADPAIDKDFQVTSVRVVGPLYGLQSRTYGYDMRPGKSLTTKQLRGFFTPWWYAPKRMVWDGSYISIQPVPAAKPQIAKPLPGTLPKASPSAMPASPPPATLPAATAGIAATSPGREGSRRTAEPQPLIDARPVQSNTDGAGTVFAITIVVIATIAVVSVALIRGRSPTKT